MREIALALPDAEEKSHFEQPDFRVRNKIFAGLSRDEKQGNLKLTPELQAMVLSANPTAFSPAAGFWGRSGWTRVALPHVALGELRELLREAHALVAPGKSRGLAASAEHTGRARPSRPTVAKSGRGQRGARAKRPRT